MNYSIVSYLSGDVYKEVRSLQEVLSNITGSRKCLDDWQPHITVADGIIISEDALVNTEDELGKFCQGREKISLKAKGFGSTTSWKGAVPDNITPYVIWLNVEINDGLLKLFHDLKNEITSHYEAWLPRIVDYTPHITLAFADLSEEGYKKGMEYIKSLNFEREFDILNVSLTECFGEGNMTSKEYMRFNFDSGSTQ